MSEPKISRHHRRRPGRPCRGGAPARTRARNRSCWKPATPSATRFGNGRMSSCSRRGNTPSTRRRCGCSSRQAGIRPIRTPTRPAASWSSATSNRSRREPRSRDRIHTSARVTGIGRVGFDKVKTDGRADAPFELRYRNGAGDKTMRADAVIDASGTWYSPNPAGASGLPAIGETISGERASPTACRTCSARSAPLRRQDASPCSARDIPRSAR